MMMHKESGQKNDPTYVHVIEPTIVDMKLSLLGNYEEEDLNRSSALSTSDLGSIHLFLISKCQDRLRLANFSLCCTFLRLLTKT